MGNKKNRNKERDYQRNLILVGLRFGVDLRGVPPENRDTALRTLMRCNPGVPVEGISVYPHVKATGKPWG